MAAANAFALLGSEESQDVARFIAAEQATAKAAKQAADELARKKRQAAPKKKQQQIDSAPDSWMMRAKRIILPYHVRRSDIIIRKEKKEGDSRKNNNGSGEKKSDLSVQNNVEQNGNTDSRGNNSGSGEKKSDLPVQNKVEQNGNGQAITDNKSNGVVSQGGGAANNNYHGRYRRGNYGGDNNYHGSYRQGNYGNYIDGNGYRPNRSNQGRRMNENNGYRSGSASQIADDNNLQVENQKQDGGNQPEEEQGWKYVGSRQRSRSSSRSGDPRRGAYGRGNNGFRRQHHQYQHRYYNGHEDNRRSNGGNVEETINGDNVSNEPEKNQVTEDNNKTDGAQGYEGAVCEPTEDHKGEVRGQKNSLSKEDQDAYEAKLKEREYYAKLMTLDQYEKVLSRKKKALDGLTQIEERRMVTLDKEFESMKLVGKKNEAGHEYEHEKLKKKDGADKEEKARKSMSINEFLKPANGANYRQPARNGDRTFTGPASNGERPFSGRGQQGERFNPNSMTRPRDTSRNFPRQQGRKPVLDTGSEKKKDTEGVLNTKSENKDNEGVLNTGSEKDFPALPGASPLPARP
ncbi:translation initiation factor IF-2-like [Tripterygium wilfordii]|uniref:translation initiation factor IF-2-like n=1 Tax=Tripterygium wilfordii TaxID=458696 RepID=UPI0018F832DE|nr:translation initiation factor IF-2-like [Tripterygium wilfordii]